MLLVLIQESPRAPTPDTESEQPTDTELSESKTGSSVTLEQRTPTPETEAELDESEIAHIDSELINVTEVDVSENYSKFRICILLMTNQYNFEQRTVEGTQEILDPLDQALTNVIQNLIKIDNRESDENVLSSQESMTILFENSCNNSIPETAGKTEIDQTTTSGTDFCDGNSQSWTLESQCSSPTVKTLKRTATSSDLSLAMDNSELSESSSTMMRNLSKRRDDDGEKLKSESIPSSPVSYAPIAATSTTSTMSIFSIGPLPTTASSSSKSVQFSNPLIVGPSNRLLAPVFGTAATELENFTDNSITSSSTIWSSSLSSNQEEEPAESRDQRSSKSDNVADSDNISVDSSSSLDTVREFPTADISPMPSSTLASKDELRESAISSQKGATSTKSQTPEEILAARADRLKRLEEQADWLMKKMNATSKRGTALCIRLEELHEAYGEPPVPPPMPDVLPSCKLPSVLLNLPRQVKARNNFINCH